MKLSAMILLLLTTFSATANDYIYLGTGDVDVGSDKAKAAEAQYNGCLRANGVDPRIAASAIELLNWVEQLRKLQLSEEATSERLLEKYEFSEYSAAMDWMMAHQTCFPQAYPNKEQYTQ